MRAVRTGGGHCAAGLGSRAGSRAGVGAAAAASRGRKGCRRDPGLSLENVHGFDSTAHVSGIPGARDVAVLLVFRP